MYTLYRPHYNVNLKSINVNGVSTLVNSEVSSDGSTGTIIDSGTTLAYFSDDVYNHVQNAVSDMICFVVISASIFSQRVKANILINNPVFFLLKILNAIQVQVTTFQWEEMTCVALSGR